MLDAGSADECKVWYELLMSATGVSETLETRELPEYCAVVEKGDELSVMRGPTERVQMPVVGRLRQAACNCPRCASNTASEEV